MKTISTEVKNLEPINTIAIAHIGDYSGIGSAFAKLCTWAAANNLWVAEPKIAGVYHDDPMQTPVDKLRSEACFENLSGVEPGEGMHAYTISGGKYFVMQVEVTMSEYGEAWKKAYATLKEKGYECDMRDHYEFYVSSPENPEDMNAPWIVELRIPVVE